MIVAVVAMILAFHCYGELNKINTDLVSNQESTKYFRKVNCRLALQSLGVVASY